MKKIQAVTSGRGLAICFLDGAPVSFQETLPNWSVVVSEDNPQSITSRDLQMARLLVRANADTPLLLIGHSSGNKAVARILHANLTRSVSGVFLSAISQGEPWELLAWAKYASQGRLVASALDPSGADLVEVALGVDLRADDARQGLYLYSSPGEATAALPGLLARHFGPGSPELPTPAAPEEWEPWRDASISHGRRLILQDLTGLQRPELEYKESDFEVDVSGRPGDLAMVDGRACRILHVREDYLLTLDGGGSIQKVRTPIPVRRIG